MTVKSKSERVRECILSNPDQTLDQIRERTKVGKHTIVYERYRLIDEGHISAPKQIRRNNNITQKNLDKLFDMCYMFTAFRDYTNEILRNIPVGCAVALLKPTTEREKNMKIELIDNLQHIQKICKAIENKYK